VLSEGREREELRDCGRRSEKVNKSVVCWRLILWSGDPRQNKSWSEIPGQEVLTESEGKKREKMVKKVRGAREGCSAGVMEKKRMEWDDQFGFGRKKREKRRKNATVKYEGGHVEKPSPLLRYEGGGP